MFDIIVVAILAIVVDSDVEEGTIGGSIWISEIGSSTPSDADDGDKPDKLMKVGIVARAVSLATLQAAVALSNYWW